MQYKDYWASGFSKRNEEYWSGKEEKSFKSGLKIEWNFSDWIFRPMSQIEIAFQGKGKLSANNMKFDFLY